MSNHNKTASVKQPKDKLLPKLTTAFFDRPKITALLWLCLTVFGILSYTIFLPREGFPSVNIPLTIVSGTYFVNDPAKVDSQVAEPISKIALAQHNTSSIQTESADNFFSVAIQYNDGTDAHAQAAALQKAVAQIANLPKTVSVQYNVPYFGATGADTQQIDLAISFYSKTNSATISQNVAAAKRATQWLNDQKLSDVKAVFVKNPFQSVTNPTTGQPVVVQQNFDRFGIRSDNRTDFYNSTIIGVTKRDGIDAIKLDDQVSAALTRLQQQSQFKNDGAQISASFAPSIKENISELQRVLLEGLLAVLVVGSIVIAIRASLITVISMVTVLAISIGFLEVIGYTLNVITLFALILGLSLIVDDTIIIVEAIDAARRKQKDRRVAVQEATRKVSRAMVAATSTAALSFAPLLFAGGILGSFIRAIPITIIASLLISLFVALVFIPFFARFLLLGKKQMGSAGMVEIAAGFESKIAQFIARPMLWARHSIKRLFFVGIVAIIFGTGFITAGLIISKNVVFNIFPPTKNTNGIAVNLNFPANTTIQQAEAITDKADTLSANVLGSNFIEGSYYQSGTAQSAMMQIQITPYNKRKVASPQLVQQLQSKFNSDFKEANVAVAQIDLGPPSASFTVEINATNRTAAFNAAKDLDSFLSTTTLKRTSGKLAHFTNVTVSSPNQFIRDNNQPIVTVTANFDGNDTTTLDDLAQTAIKNKFTSQKVESYGLSGNAISFNIGQESQNQNSFKTLVLAFPILLFVIFLLLAFQFRSLLQPLLIFTAIPFSIFGIMLGLDITHNAISFFALLGFFALVGLSIKNTILLTDFANQARRSGLGPIDAAVAALEERFRPLFATSMTAVVSLIPLALTSPFWQGLAVVLIFGLLSSTFLVVTVFPYYYLGAEYLRLHISARDFFIWLIPTVIATAAVTKLTTIGYGLTIIPLSLIYVIFDTLLRKRIART